MALLLPSENPLLHDEEIAVIFSDDHFLETILKFEKTLARIQAELGIIPDDAANELQQLSIAGIDRAALVKGMQRDGVVIPALLKQLKASESREAAQWLHFGVTSQDAVDTALILILREINGIIVSRLDGIVELMAIMVDQNRNTRLMARTRQRSAVPTSFGFIVASWLATLLRQKQRIREIDPRLYRLQLGGAAGHLSAIDASPGIRLVQQMGEALNLHCTGGSWHSQRDNLVEYGNWLAMTCGCLAKVAEDLIALSADEVSEVSITSVGGSSTMPQKQNPIMLEHIVTLNRLVSNHQISMQQALVNILQRDGRGWMLEWLTLPAMVMATGKSLSLVIEVLSGLQIHQGRMNKNISANLGLVFAEAATFKLAEVVKPAEARILIAEACKESVNSRRQLLDVLSEDSRFAGFGINWQSLDESWSTGLSHEFIQQILDSID